MVVPLATGVSGNDDYQRACGTKESPLQGTDSFGSLPGGGIQSRLVTTPGRTTSGIALNRVTGSIPMRSENDRMRRAERSEESHPGDPGLDEGLTQGGGAGPSRRPETEAPDDATALPALPERDRRRRRAVRRG